MKRKVGLLGKTRKTLGKDKGGDWVLLLEERSHRDTLATVELEKMLQGGEVLRSGKKFGFGKHIAWSCGVARWHPSSLLNGYDGRFHFRSRIGTTVVLPQKKIQLLL